MANLQEAYDFSLFEDHGSSAAPEIAPARDPRRQGNVVELPEIEQPQPKRQERARSQPRPRPRRNPLKMTVAVICSLALFATALLAVYSEVQLTELTKQISDAKSDLEEAKSLEVQLTMQAAQRMSDAQVEEYVSQQLGMGKVTGSQVVYMHVAQQDKGRVVQELEGGSWLDELLDKVREILAG